MREGGLYPHYEDDSHAVDCCCRQPSYGLKRDDEWDANEAGSHFRKWIYEKIAEEIERAEHDEKVQQEELEEFQQLGLLKPSRDDTPKENPIVRTLKPLKHKTTVKGKDYTHYE